MNLVWLGSPIEIFDHQKYWCVKLPDVNNNVGQLQR